LPLKARVREIGSLATVLVLGVTGMAGYLAVQHARLLGANRVVGVGRDPARLARAAALGAATVALSGNRERCRGNRRRSRRYDTEHRARLSVGVGSRDCLRFARRRGLEEDTADIAYTQIGAAAGPEAAVPAALLRSRRIRISGSGAGSAQIADIMAEVPAYMQLIADRSVDVPTKTVPLASISEAWTSADGTYRIVVVP
jgi:threonine dehydrogenase-like Zn-dependent dehydrogenase